VDDPHPRVDDHWQDEACFPVPPCDWRFLPKLGPLRRQSARAFFFFY
jgi:hypothetical protein